MLGVGASKKTYLDDLFSTQVYTGTGSAKTITNGINLSGEGGMVWTKARNDTYRHGLMDTVRGTGGYLQSSSSNAQATDSTVITAYNANGYTLGTDSNYLLVNRSTEEYASWTFRKAPGFFDVVSYTSSISSAGGTQTINHNLKCVPGLIMIKRTDSTGNWVVYHRSIGNDKILYLNTTDDAATNMDQFDKTDPTASSFTVEHTGSGSNDVGIPSATYVAYLFAGGESTAATARSVDFDGVGDALVSNTSTDYVIGTNDFTLELWVKFKDNFNGKQSVLDFDKSSNAPTTPFEIYGQSQYINFGTTASVLNYKVVSKQWNHVAFVRTSGTTTLYLNGEKVDTFSDSNNYDSNQITIGGGGTNTALDNASCFVSNVRLVVGTAVYTSSFRPPTEPLTNITNTKFLACQNSTTTGCTVGTIQAADGNPTASSDSPFDDPAGFVFGENEDQNLIKCGTYIGNGSTDGPVIDLGWEPQWILIKRSNSSENWIMFDAIRGMTTQAGNDHDLRPDLSNSEGDTRDYIDITPTGFKQVNTQAMMNGNNDTYVYLAIRRSDGYVGKPADAGTDVFTMDTGNSNANQAFTSGFPVDYAFYKEPASTASWYSHSRLTGKKYMYIDVGNQTEQTNSWAAWDDNTGWAENTYYNSDFQSWMWKRGAGFDVVTTKGGSGKLVPHSLGGVPEMIWLKARDSSQDWKCYHFGVNGGTNPEQYGLVLDSSGAQLQSDGFWNNVAPTATHFSTGTWTSGGGSSSVNYMMMLFRSISGISKCGYYTGTESNNAITTGFQPRFVFVKCTSTAASWVVWDSLRGVGNYLLLDDDAAQGSASVVTFDSTGFTLTGTSDSSNGSGEKYIYYAHA